jgi:aspartate racemase
MQERRRQGVLGIVGGMGPLASAEFLKTIYEYSLGDYEQSAPAVMLYSDPSFPDRTQALLAGSSRVLLEQLIEALHQLRHMGAYRIVICCITIHQLLPALPPELRRDVISLIDVIFDDLSLAREKHLLFCTTGTRQLGIFNQHERWERLRDFIVWPDEADQRTVHQLIYQVKRNRNVRDLFSTFESLLTKYNLDSFITGCTEMHLLAKSFMASEENRDRYSYIDPLITIAKRVGAQSL